ncbi:MAG: hypothetical protein RMK29_05095 [Myxococcales bacterium]|nr:hypothetical protein [Myxococcota bacterium]MDW8281067.1 hypothetical protein [Myxococcales bacterium]
MVATRWLCGALLAAATGCLVPLPLSGDNPVDGGRWLMITDAIPPFGTQLAIRQDVDFDYTLDLRTDSAAVAGRLYVHVNGDCCELEVTNPQKVHFLQEAVMITAVEPGRFRMSWMDVRPCYHVPPRAVAYVVPVVASGGFVGGPTEKLEAVGLLDKHHYWSVHCP